MCAAWPTPLIRLASIKMAGFPFFFAPVRARARPLLSLGDCKALFSPRGFSTLLLLIKAEAASLAIDCQKLEGRVYAYLVTFTSTQAPIPKSKDRLGV